MKTFFSELPSMRNPDAPGRRQGSVVTLVLGLSLLLLFLACVPRRSLAQDAPAPVAPTALPAVEALTKEQVQALLVSAEEAMARLAEDAAEGSPEGKRRVFLGRRVALASEYLALLGRREASTERRAGLEAPRRQAASELAELARAPEPVKPSGPDQAGFDQLGDRVTQQRDKVGRIRAALRMAQSKVTSLPGLVAEVEARATEATRQGSSLTEELTAETGAVARRLLELRIDNARIERRLALRTAEYLQEEAEVRGVEVPVLEKELEVVQRRLARLEAEFALYGSALEAVLARSQDRLEASLARDERRAEEAETAEERLLASWQARIGRSRKQKGDAEARLVVLRKEVAEQKKRLATEEEDLANLRELLRQSGNASRASSRIKTVFRNLARRRSSLEVLSRSSFEADLEAHRSRRFEIDDLLIDLGMSEREELAAALTTLPEGQRESFRERAEELLSELRDVLREEKFLLTEAIAEGQKLQSTLARRFGVLVETDRFIRTEAFWLQDASALWSALIDRLAWEIDRLHTWVTRPGPGGPWGWLTSFASPVTLAAEALLFLLVLPGILLYARRRMVAYLERDVAAQEQGEPGLLRRLLLVSAMLLGATVVPAYLQVLSWGVEGLGDLTSPAAALAATLDHLSRSLLLFLLTRTLFGPRGIARVHFGLVETAADALYGASRVVALAYGVFLLPWAVLAAPPFELAALPRLGYTIFEVLAAAAFLWLLRAGSGLFAPEVEAGGGKGPTGWRSHRAKVAWVLGPITIGVVLLDVIGFRYSAESIGRSLLETLLVFLVLPALHLITQAALVAASQRLAEGGREDPDAPAAESGETPETPGLALARTRAATRLFFLLLGVVLVARAWGIDEGAFDSLGRITLISTVTAGGVEDLVTAADLLWSLVILALTFGFNLYLPALLQALVFPRLEFDEGLSYAVTTLFRYGLVVVGVFLALGALKVDLASLGWLMGALSVGLGFGLQEIVSNFVCGLILLIERPVRVGDVVSVGGKVGTITKINIRATTILNFDRQEEILPNRSFITGDVTNWTRGDTILRLVVPIGVAYGSDVDRVSELLLELAKQNPNVLEAPAPSVIFMDHGDSSLLFDLRVFVPSPEDRFVTKGQLNKAINKALGEAGIEIPFPQRDLHIRSSDVPLGGAPVGAGADDPE